MFGLEIPDKYKYIQVDDFGPILIQIYLVERFGPHIFDKCDMNTNKIKNLNMFSQFFICSK